MKEKCTCDWERSFPSRVITSAYNAPFCPDISLRSQESSRFCLARCFRSRERSSTTTSYSVARGCSSHEETLWHEGVGFFPEILPSRPKTCRQLETCDLQKSLTHGDILFRRENHCDPVKYNLTSNRLQHKFQGKQHTKPCTASWLEDTQPNVCSGCLGRRRTLYSVTQHTKRIDRGHNVFASKGQGELL